jgi:hypothetical protein
MADLRALAVQTLRANPNWYTLMQDRVVQQSSQITEDVRPFCVVKLGIDAEIDRWRQGPREKLVELWIHDRPGDYAQIDQLGELAKAAFAAIPNQENFLESRFISGSQDLEDPELGTIFRVFRFQWTTSS